MAKVNVTPVFASYLAGNLGPTLSDPDAREPPDYGIEAHLEGAVIELVLTFRTGVAYCCGEWQCHLCLFPTRRWDRLRREFVAVGLNISRQLKLRVDVRAEFGALFLTGSTPAALMPSIGFQHREVVTESDRPGADDENQ